MLPHLATRCRPVKQIACMTGREVERATPDLSQAGSTFTRTARRRPGS